VTFEKVRQAALKLPDVEEGTAWGFPTFRVKKKMFLCFRVDLGAVAVRATFDQRDAMIEEEPKTFFTTDHHRPYPWVLAYVTRLRATVLPGLVQMAWNHAVSENRSKSSKSKWK
jgi:hypothetical protein